MRKLISILFVCVMALSAVACGGDNGDKNTDITVSSTDVYVSIGYAPSDIVLRYSKPSKDVAVEFIYDEDKLVIDERNLTIRALAEGVHRVKIKCGDNETSFRAICEKVDRNNTKFGLNVDWKAYAAQLNAKWKAEATNGVTTLFIGDSFFDVRHFWTNFYDTYAKHDAISFGIGATFSTTWEVLYDTIFDGVVPANLAVNIGTNNIFALGTSVDETVSDLQRMFRTYHAKLPNTKIYYYSIAQRAGSTLMTGYISKVNDIMNEFCADRDWITFLDIEDEITLDMLWPSDQLHPSLPTYDVYTSALADAGAVIAPKTPSAA